MRSRSRRTRSSRSSRRLAHTLALAAAALSVATIGVTRPATGDVRACSPLSDDTPAHAQLVRAMAAPTDILGDRLLASRKGPSVRAVRRLLQPLLLARGPGGRPLTTSGAYPVVFAMPAGPTGDKAFALHVADGSEIVTRRIGGPAVRIIVGPAGDEPFGSCLERLAQPRLRAGYLPILETGYTDSAGNRYRQESFATRRPGSDLLVSYVRLAITPNAVPGARLTVRLLPSSVPDVRRLRFVGGRFDGRGVRFDVTRPTRITFAWIHSAVLRLPGPAPSAYDAERARVEAFWRHALSAGARISVPETEVMNAVRNVLIQELVHTWRYSIGNQYEELSYAESLDAAQVMAAYGFTRTADAILRFALRRLPERFTNWRAGASLVATARLQALAPDRALLADVTPTLTVAINRLGRQIERPGGGGLLEPEQFSNDVREKVVSLHGQLAVWQGLSGMARTWRATGWPAQAARADRLAGRLAAGLRSAIAASTRRAADGSLFVPADLLSGRRPFADVTASRDGSYWNLVAPYALASGFLAPHSALADGIDRYLRSHGTRLLGLVRSRIGTLTAGRAPSSGVNPVYDFAAARFVADRDEPDRLVLALSGTLGATMTDGTYVSGEATSVVPLDAAGARETYLPPNGGANASFLETLRLAFVQEPRTATGAPDGIHLAFATPRRWLRDGATVRVRGLRTSFGPIAFVIARRGLTLRATIAAPPSPSLAVRFRVPADVRVAEASVNGQPVTVDAATGTLALPRHGGHLDVVVRLALRG